MILSDKIHYRADGTVSSVQRTTSETYLTPSGREQTEETTAEVPLAAISSHLAGPYADLDAHNKTLEAQIVSEREASDKAIAERDLQIKDLTNRLAVAEGKLKAIADVDRQYDEVVKPLLAPATPAA